MIVAIPPTIKGLNPFENQVYFYLRNHQWEDSPRSLNPFENQVYFYRVLIMVVRWLGALS